ncbi:MAG: CopG family transcriptional regulator, partial [Pseudomonadota bacterium]
ATATRRTKSFLSNEALERYLSEEEDFLNAVNEGLKDAEAGRVSSLEVVQAAMHKAITKASK